MVALLAGSLGGVLLLRDYEAKTRLSLDRSRHEVQSRIQATVVGMSGYAAAVGQRRDLRAAVERGDVPLLVRDATELYWDLRAADPTVRVVELALPALGLRVLGERGEVRTDSGPLPADLEIAMQGERFGGMLTSDDGRPAIGAAVPITGDDGRVVGAIRVAALLNAATARELGQVTRSEIVLIVDGQPPVSTLRVPDHDLPPWLTQAVQQGAAERGRIVLDGVRYLAALEPLEDAAFRKLGAVAVLLPEAQFRAGIESAMLALGVALGLILLVTVPLVLAASGRLGRPIGQLSVALARLREGDTEAELPAPGPGAAREILELTAAFEAFRQSQIERERLSEKLVWMAAFDPLTRLPNRSMFTERLDEALERSRGLAQVAVHMVDLDLFKEVNDTHGHAAGDAVLREIATRLQLELRRGDLVARLGGDEFAVIQPIVQGEEQAAILAERLVETLARPIDLDGRPTRLGGSVGFALSDPASDDAESMLRRADVALYRAKADGRNRFAAFRPEMDAALIERTSLGLDLRRAIEQDELRLVFQPLVDLADGRLLGAESLLRWRHPQRGEVSPAQFIPIAEEIGLIPRIGSFVLREACRIATGWPGLRVAVNVSPLQLRSDEFLETLDLALAESGLAPDLLELEITEGVLMENAEATIGLLHRIRAVGVRLAIDDFGTGYSSLGQLHRFRFDKIKLDRLFIARLDVDEQAVAMVRAVVGLTRALGVRLNAEGIETELQAAILRAEGVAEGQGWLFGRPLERAAFEAHAAASVGPRPDLADLSAEPIEAAARGRLERMTSDAA